MTGIGHPQYLCLDTPQSLILKLIFSLPIPSLSRKTKIFFIASSLFRPLSKGELIKVPVSVKGSALSSQSITFIIGKEYFFAN